MQTGPIQLQVLVFELAGRACAFALEDVREVLRAVTIQPLPKAPAIVEGVINLRGALVPVLNIAARFDLTTGPLSASDQFIVLRLPSPLAVRVQRCLTLATVAMVRHQEKGPLPCGVMHVAGFALVPEGVLVIYDLRAFLSEQESQELSGALDAAATSREEAPA